MAGAFACVGSVFLGLGQPLDRPIPSVHRGATLGQPHAGPPSRRPAHQRDNPAHLPVCGVYAGGAAASSPASMSWTARVRIPGPQPTEERAERWRGVEADHAEPISSPKTGARSGSESSPTTMADASCVDSQAPTWITSPEVRTIASATFGCCVTTVTCRGPGMTVGGRRDDRADESESPKSTPDSSNKYSMATNNYSIR